MFCPQRIKNKINKQKHTPIGVGELFYCVCYYICLVFFQNYAKISRIAKNELFMSFSPQQR